MVTLPTARLEVETRQKEACPKSQETPRYIRVKVTARHGGLEDETTYPPIPLGRTTRLRTSPLTTAALWIGRGRLADSFRCSRCLIVDVRVWVASSTVSQNHIADSEYRKRTPSSAVTPSHSPSREGLSTIRTTERRIICVFPFVSFEILQPRVLGSALTILTVSRRWVDE